MTATTQKLTRASIRHNKTRMRTELPGITRTEIETAAVDTDQRRLEAVMKQNDELLEIRSLLTKKVSSLERALVKAHQFTHYDELTGLANRRLLLDRFMQAAALADRHHKQLALLFFDLNEFKDVNDRLGHHAGDKLLQQVAMRLSSSIRASDTACRYGGDEFVVLLAEVTDHGHVVESLKKIRARLAPPYMVDRFSIRIAVSTGLAIYPDDAQSFTDLLLLSDRFMFSNKPGSRRRTSDTNNANIWLQDTEKQACLSR